MINSSMALCSSDKNKETVLVLASTFPRWPGDDQPRFVLDLCKRLKYDYNVIVLAPGCLGAKNEEVLEGVSVTRFHYAPRRFESVAYGGGILSQLRSNKFRCFWLPFFFLSMIIHAVFIIRRHRCSIIHAHWIIPQGLAACMALLCLRRKNRPRLVLTSHGADLYSLNGWPLRILKAWVLSRSARVSVVSNAMKNRVLALVPEASSKLRVIPMGTDIVQRFRPVTSVKTIHPSFLFVGRLVEKKGVHVLLRAMREVLVSFPNAELKIVGDGPLRKSLEDYCLELKIEKSVVFVGSTKQHELVNYYSDAHAAVFPFVVASNGDQEGLGLVVVEAQACKTLVITTDIPATEDTMLCGDQKEWLVPKNDYLALSEKMKKVAMLDQNELASRLENWRNQARERFDWSIISDRYSKEIYRFENGSIE